MCEKYGQLLLLQAAISAHCKDLYKKVKPAFSLRLSITKGSRIRFYFITTDGIKNGQKKD